MDVNGSVLYDFYSRIDFPVEKKFLIRSNLKNNKNKLFKLQKVAIHKYHRDGDSEPSFIIRLSKDDEFDDWLDGLFDRSNELFIIPRCKCSGPFFKKCPKCGQQTDMIESGDIHFTQDSKIGQTLVNHNGNEVIFDKTIERESVIDKILGENTITKSKYRYIVNVREGAPGFADDDFHQSGYYDSFQSCLEKLKKFDPKKHWNHLRYVESKNILEYQDNKLINKFLIK